MTGKILSLIIATIVIAITLGRVNSLVRERISLQRDAEENIAKVFSGPQKVSGPVAIIKLNQTWTENIAKDSEIVRIVRNERIINKVYFPISVDYAVSMNVEERSRGIYKVPIYFTQGSMDGSIVIPPLETLKTREDATLTLVEAFILISVSDMRGFTSVPKITWDGASLPVDPKSGGNGLKAPIPLTLKGTGGIIPFHVDVKLHGMKGLQVAPLATDSSVTITSPWPHPSFSGAFLPLTRSISGDGFAANWRVSAVASLNQSQISDSVEGGNGFAEPGQSFGVDLVNPVNHYTMTDRALKYGLLFISLTFVSFFLFETLKSLKIHPIQYTFVGLAQALFFLLLLSLSEHLGFLESYLLGAGGTAASITIYLSSVMKGTARGLSFGGALAVVYAALYGLLQSEDNALVFGALLLFAGWTGVMILTRNVDWYELAGGNIKPAVTPPSA